MPFNINIEHIAQLITAYEEIVPLPVDWLVGIIALGVVAILFIRRKYPGFVTQAAWGLLALYVLLLLFGTVLFREVSPNMRYHFEPLVNYSYMYDTFIADTLVNVGMFAPIGFLGAITFGYRNMLKVVAVGCTMSILVELAQLVGRRGVCNIDDVIHNTLGCAIGYGIFLIVDKLFHLIFDKRIKDAHTLFC